jgi:hypothetical protein
MRSARKIACFVVIALLAAIGVAGCYVPPPGTPGGPMLNIMTLCIYTDDPETLTLVMTVVDDDGNPILDDETHVPYVNYTALASTFVRGLPNECESQRPYHPVHLKAAEGTVINSTIQVTGEHRSTLLTCVYYVNGVAVPSTRADRRNWLDCNYTGRV